MQRALRLVVVPAGDTAAGVHGRGWASPRLVISWSSAVFKVSWHYGLFVAAGFGSHGYAIQLMGTLPLPVRIPLQTVQAARLLAINAMIVMHLAVQ
jgi:hypothetical protein